MDIYDKKVEISLYKPLVKWFKYLQMKKLVGQKKDVKNEKRGFWDFLRENILHFVTTEQKNLNRKMINKDSIFPTIEKNKILNLNNVFGNIQSRTSHQIQQEGQATS